MAITKSQRARAIKAGQKDGRQVLGRYIAGQEENAAWTAAGYAGLRPFGSPAMVELFHQWLTEYKIAYRLAAQGCQCPA